MFISVQRLYDRGWKLESNVDESIVFFLRSNTKLATIFSRKSDSNSAWYRVKILLRSSENEAVSSG